MLTTSRDCKRDSARNAIPSLGEIEGRMAVLEVVAQAALTHALAEGDDSVDKSLIAEIREAMHDKCGEMKLDRTDARAAVFYAEELICAAIQASHIVRQ
ncbi:hypothetical protein AB4Z52_03135 [Rhizobium sp. 2YAF20]|jgi:thiamine pyrophosphokinase|uniref:hypothetical protein n=1 Tax=Rhizobium sp. 2YAF20 TaxID=3233027 RepID=UPI003F9B75DF